MKKKVLFVITKSNWGGAQRYVFDLATTLPTENYAVAVALGGAGGKDAEPGALAHKLEQSGVRLLVVRSFMRDISLLREWAALRELVALFRAEAPDVVHLNSSKAGGLGALAARRAGVPNIIFTSHGLAWDEDRNFFSKAAIYLLSKFTFMLCHTVIVITEDNLRRAGTRKAVLVHNGIAPQIFLPQQEARAKLAERLRPLPSAELWLGTIGELTRNKGQHYLLEAAKLLKQKNTPFTLVLIGEGEERKNLERQIKKDGLEGLVYLPGFVPQAAQYLPAFDVFVLPSLKEGLPYVLLEAGLAGVPIVATKIGGVPDILDAALPAPKDSRALAEAIQSLISNEAGREQAAAALKARIEKEFSLQKMVEQTVILY